MLLSPLKILWIDFSDDQEIFVITVDGIDCSIFEPQSPGGIGELDTLLLELLQDIEIDRLLNIHIAVVVCQQHVVHDFELQGEIAVAISHACSELPNSV